MKINIIYQNERRYNYTTPKSFLEQISLYRNLLQTKRREHEDGILRLENGLVKLESYVKLNIKVCEN
jgi:dynein heavy chain